MILKKVYFSTFLRFVVSVTLVSFAQTGGLLLEGDSIKYFGANIPINLAAAVIAEVILVRGAEFYRSTNKSPLGSGSAQCYSYCMLHLREMRL